VIQFDCAVASWVRPIALTEAIRKRDKIPMYHCLASGEEIGLSEALLVSIFMFLESGSSAD
jgi:hypothetical protein